MYYTFSGKVRMALKNQPNIYLEVVFLESTPLLIKADSEQEAESMLENWALVNVGAYTEFSEFSYDGRFEKYDG